MTEISGRATDVVVPLDKSSAERLDKRVRLMAGAARDSFEKLGRLLDEAKSGQVHEALGFKSWPAYVADAIGGQLQLSPDARRSMVALMSGEGMSERAIAEATGASKSTVHRDLVEVVQNRPPALALAGDAGDSSSPQPATTAVSENRSPITTLDGKTFSRPKPKPTPPEGKSSTPPITKRYKTLSGDMRRMADRISKLLEEERFEANREALARDLQPYGRFLADASTRLHQALSTAGEVGS
ncbi:sporulation transcriptional regulator SpoIIID [Mycobacterium sp. MBM]|nr:sporulation transcriptional regulator SpoIIID [Mycobacterium sp. MBM]